MDYAKLELKLRKIVERRLEEGWEFTPGLGVRSDTGDVIRGCACCIIGAIAIEAGVTTDQGVFAEKKSARNAAADTSGLSHSLLGAIENVFEKFYDSGLYPKAFAIGERLRRLYCEFEDAS